MTPTMADQAAESRRMLRELQENPYKLGTWSFEHEDKVKIKLDDYSIGVTLIEPKMVNI